MGDNVFEKLRTRLAETEAWLANFTRQPVSASELELVDLLRRYLRHCRHDERKWHSAPAARRATLKIEELSVALDSPPTAKGPEMITLSTEVSGPVVGEIVASVGELRAAEWLGVTPSRLAALSGGRGRLNESQLERIAAATGKSWQLWAMEAAARLATTAADRRLIAETRPLFEPATQGRSPGSASAGERQSAAKGRQTLPAPARRRRAAV